jgi:hypothetical protein
LFEDIRQIIGEARRSVATTINAGLTLLYWRIGKRIIHEVLGKERAVYGQQIVVLLARQLAQEFGPSFGEKNLRQMMQFAEVFPERGNCRIADTTIELDPLHRSATPKKRAATRVLRGALPRLRVERQQAAAKNRLHALRADGSVP